jgi:hypothetical protein
MNKIACIFFEGNDSKVALFQQDGSGIKLIKAESIDMSLAFNEQKAATVGKSNGGNKQKNEYNYNFVTEESTAFNRNYLQKLNEFFLGEDLSKCKFIPILCEPAIYFHKINDEKDLASLNINNRGKIETTIEFIQMYDDSRLAVYPSGQSNYLQAIDSLARMNNKKYFKIPTVKSAEISLASYVARYRKFGAKENSLILYIGKEYSKVIFLKGEKLYHIGSTLAVGKNSFNAHNVIVSKILLAMEHGSLNTLENIIICGEDNSDDFVSIIKDAYPRAKVYTQSIKSMDVNSIDSFSTESAFIVTAAVAEEYFAEMDKKSLGINLLPNYIKEEQKIFHFGWQGYLVMLLTLISIGFFTMTILSNAEELQEKESEINKLMLIQAQNRDKVNQIKSYENKIQNVDQTKVILNQLSSGTGIFSDQLKKLSGFTNQRRNLWISDLAIDQNKNIKISGYTFSRTMVKQLSDSYNGAILQNIVFEPMRDLRAFKFSINAGNLMGEVSNEKKN